MNQARFGLFNKTGKRVGTASFSGKSHKAAHAAGVGYMRRMGVRSVKSRNPDYSAFGGLMDAYHSPKAKRRGRKKGRLRGYRGRRARAHVIAKDFPRLTKGGKDKAAIARLVRKLGK